MRDRVLHYIAVSFNSSIYSFYLISMCYKAGEGGKVFGLCGVEWPGEEVVEKVNENGGEEGGSEKERKWCK